MIKKLLFLTAVMATAFTTINAQNLILNGDFETGTGNTFTNWTALNGAASMTSEAIEIHNGLRALKAIPTGVVGQQWKLQLESDAVTTVIGKSYELSMWVKGASAGNTVRFSNNIPTYGTDVPVIGGTWQKVFYTFTATAATTKIRLELGGNTTAANTFYVDDVAMYDVTATSKNFILNGDLELGSGDVTTNWSRANNPNGNSIVAETTIVHSGTRALKILSSGTPTTQYAVQLTSDAMTLELGRSYTASMWINAVTGGNKVRFSTATTPAGNENYGPDTALAAGWQQITYTFTAKSSSTKLNLDLGGSSDTYYIDDIALTGVSPTLGSEKFDINNNKTVFYPNPVTDNLNINSEADIKSVIISDLNGKIVRTIKNVENIQSVNLSDLSQGLYILSTDTNKQFKFIKK